MKPIQNNNDSSNLNSPFRETAIIKIFLIGFMGCGKTHWGKILSKKLNVPFFDLDEKIVEQTGKSISEIFETEGVEQFRLLEKNILQQLTEIHETFVIATGGGTPCFHNNMDYLKKHGTVVWINSSTDSLYQRLVKEKAQRPLISDVPDEELKSFIHKKYSGRKVFYQQASVILPDETLTIENLIDAIFKK